MGRKAGRQASPTPQHRPGDPLPQPALCTTCHRGDSGPQCTVGLEPPAGKLRLTPRGLRLERPPLCLAAPRHGNKAHRR